MSNQTPGLDQLHVFEACGRCLSFTAAAAELGMSQPAVSQQMLRLERMLGTRLFERVYRGIHLTAAGTELLEPVQEALELVRGALVHASKQSPRELLAVATDFAFAAYWLMPRLDRFYRQYPRIDVSLVTSNRALTRLPPDVDLAMVFGDGAVRGGDTQLLFQEEVFPVCSPRLLQAHRGDGLAVLGSAPRLHLKPAPGQHWFDWDGLSRAWKLAPSTDEREDPRFDNYTLLIGAALAGQGVAIGWRHLIDPLLAQGLLCRLNEAGGSLTSNYGYHLVSARRKRRPASVRRFVDWLQVELPDCATVDLRHG